MQRGLILFAHGARDPAWSRPLHALAELVVRREPTLCVRIAYLEMQAPDLSAAIDELAPHCAEVTVLPVFWAAAGHVSKEMPSLLEAARARHPGLMLSDPPPLSELPGLLEFLAETVVALSQDRRTVLPARQRDAR